MKLKKTYNNMLRNNKLYINKGDRIVLKKVMGFQR